VARGWGDCKDKATVIVTLLKELGIASTMVLVRSQMRGAFASKLPSLAPFDHAIVYVPSLKLYLDGTAEYTGSTELPRLDEEALGLLVNEGDAELVRLPRSDPSQNSVKRELEATVSRDGQAKLEIRYLTTGTVASEWRRRYHAKPTLRDRVSSDLGREFAGFKIATLPTGVVTNNLEDMEQPVQISISGFAPAFARTEGNQLSIAVTPAQRLTPEYASRSRRTQPVRILGANGSEDTVVIKLPPGSRVVSAPVPTRADTPFGSYSVELEQQPGKVTVHSRLLLKMSQIPLEKYAAWRLFCSDADRAFNQRLVIAP
jgi:hypothetical protein